MRWILPAVLALCLFLSPSLASGESLPLLDASCVASRFVSNPRNVKDIGDPMVVCTEEGYLVFATGGPIGFNVWSSPDLIAFDKTKALKKVAWASGDYWAPEVYPVEDRWVMLFTARERASGSLRTGIAFADAAAGPYEDPLGRPLFDLGYATIDATLTYDDAGKPYLIYVRDCSENVVDARNESHIYGVALSDDLLSLEGEPVLLLKPEGDWETRSGDTRWNEGPFVVRHEGKYYLYYSVNGYWMKEYSVCAAVADAPLGPYVKCANNPLLQYLEKDGEVLVSGPGHNSFLTIGEELFTAYHTHTYPLAPSGNRQLCLDRAGFHRDGTPYICGPTLAPQLKPLSELGLVNLMQTAQTADDEAGFLTDGDICVAETSEPYLWAGNRVTFTWESPVTADLLLIYGKSGQSLSGKVTINGELTADLETVVADAGAAALLAFLPLQVSSLTFAFEPGAEAMIGEIMLIGPGDGGE